MSNHTITAIHKKTEIIHKVKCLDNYFGRRVYGYDLENGTGVMMPDEFNKYFERENSDAPNNT